MVIPEWKVSTWAYYFTVVVLGTIVVCGSLFSLAIGSQATAPAPQTDWSWLALLLPIVLFRKTYIQLPNCDGRICPTAIFTVYAALSYGPREAAIIAMGEALLASLGQNMLPFVRLLFNIAAIPLAAFAAAQLGHGHLFTSIHLPVVPEIFSQALVIALTYYIANMGIVLGMMALVGGRKALVAVRGTLLWSWATYAVAGNGAALMAVLGGGSADVLMVTGVSIPCLYLTYRTLKHYFAVLRQRDEFLADLHATHMASLATLATAIEAKDSLTHGHVTRVEALSVALGKALQMPQEELEALRVAAMLHDIGKLALPEYLLFSSHKLTPEDRMRLQSHAQVGASILSNGRLHPSVVPMVRQHHERYDGAGFPDQLAGDNICFGARILAVADTYDTLRYPREGTPLQRNEALDHIARESGVSLDPQIVRCLLEQADTLLAGVESVSAHPSKPAQAKEGPSFVEHFQASREEDNMRFMLHEQLKGTVELKVLLSGLMKILHTAVPFSFTQIHLPDPLTGELVLVHGPGRERGEHDRASSRAVAQLVRSVGTPVVTVFETPPAELVQGLAEDLAEAGPEAARAFTPCALARLSLGQHPQGHYEFGWLLIGHSEAFQYQDHHQRMVKVISDYAGPAIAAARAFDRTRLESCTDALTGLPNNRALVNEGAQLLKNALEQGLSGYVIMMDLNGFKAVNDTLGHHEGDRLLVEVGRVLNKHLRKRDLVVRKGGDEFVMLLIDVSYETVMERLELISQDARALWPDGWPMEPGKRGISAGVAGFPGQGMTLNALLEVADTRMYIDKAKKKEQRPVAKTAGEEAPRTGLSSGRLSRGLLTPGQASGTPPGTSLH